MILDAHVHLLHEEARTTLCRLPNEEAIHAAFEDASQSMIERATLEHLRTSMDAARIDQALVFGFPWNTQEHCHDNNSYVLECVRTDHRLRAFCVVQPRSSDAIDEVERRVDEGFVGVKLKPTWQGYSIDDESVTGEFLTHLETRSIPLLLHVSHAYKPPGPDHAFRLVRVLERHPNLQVIAAHLGGGLFVYETYEEIKHAARRIVYDTSVPRSPRMIAAAAHILPAEKLVFGSDFPFDDQRSMLDDLRASVTDQDVLTKILAGDALQNILKR